MYGVYRWWVRQLEIKANIAPLPLVCCSVQALVMLELWFLLLHLLLSSDTITSLFELPTYTAMLCCKVGTYLYYGTFEQVWSYCFLIRAATKKNTAARRTAPHRTAPHPTHWRVLLSGYPNQEIRWPYLFKGLIIIIVCSYFGDNSAT